PGAALPLRLLLSDGDALLAALAAGNIEHLQLGIVGRRLPVLAARNARAERADGAVAPRGRPLDIGLDCQRRVIGQRQAGLRVETRRPAHVVGVLLAVDELAGHPVETVEVAVAAG